MKGDLTGGCLCVAVRYSLREGFRFRPYACHCTDCQTRTGAAFNEHMLFARQDLEIEGELDSGSYEQPSGAVSTIWGCAKCKVRIFAENDKRPGFASLRCGTLDRSAEIVPVVSPAVV
ncbi:GFA family protein [Porphyrobacter sp. HT-58-2]|uniref:GFA family protein n=1 Tax=Porphyrobacter sp. HT-58-2 TaxID=2023229 RepID=UPI001559EE19|nr:GFA family protein [Porphyrobacter sp. HT-58-2]